MRTEDGRSRILGALLGTAVGDALGVPVEFATRAERDADPVTGMRGHGTWRQEPGTWSDDTSLALCLAESVALRGFDPGDFGERALRWLDHAHWTARGAVFDVGGATRRALDRIRGGLPAVLAGGRGENDNGNGALMRILPASIWLAGTPEPARWRALAAYSATTHGHPRSMLAAWLHGLVTAALLEGAPPAEAYASAMAAARAGLPGLPPAFRAEEGIMGRALGGRLGGLPRSSIRGSGYVVHCLEAALWCLLTTSDFASCVLAAVNLGEDADTTAAVAGGLAGLAYGLDAVPDEWRSRIARAAEIEALAEALADTVSRRTPFPGSYWVAPGKLLAGPHPGHADEDRPRFEALLDSGVDSFLDLTREGERLRGRPLDSYAGLVASLAAERGTGRTPEVRRVAIADMSAPPSETLRRALGEIDAMLAAGHTVYVHCLGGVGRTGTTVGCWLVERGLAAPGEALGLLAALRADSGGASPETGAQRDLVSSWRPGPGALAL